MPLPAHSSVSEEIDLPQPPTLDPATPEEWQELRALGHRMLDDAFDGLATLREQPAWRPLPDESAAALALPLPAHGRPAAEVYRTLLEHLVPYTIGNRHPRAWGWVRGTGTPLAMLADMLASGLNAHVAGGQQAPVVVEATCLRWLAELMGMPPESSGLLTTGATMANLIGLAVGRYAKAGYDIREHGLQGCVHPQLLIYGSTETHSWALKAIELMGLGRNAYRRIPVNDQHRIDLDQLELQIERDRDAGHRPAVVIANCGTVNTGAIDDLPAIAALCRKHDLWFHVDGAFGALLRLTKEYAGLVRGIEEADSLAFDLHKWVYLPFEIGCVLVRDPKLHTAAFATQASYLEEAEGGIMAGGLPFADRGVELTRGFRALKLWMSFEAHGVDTYARLIAQNMAQAAHLEKLIEASPRLELTAPRPTNVVCFRYRRDDLTPDALNALNRRLTIELQESGRYIVSGTVLDGNYALRVAITNHRSQMDDFTALAEDCVHFGDQLASEA
ncbi:MAG TPA: aminotransferase class V-fold PLP-dependent enzyme [Acidobacteriaceae bacterium]|jgi:glutamate/tyrosine decarboxylase-like PLP-dependent enzyme